MDDYVSFEVAKKLKEKNFIGNVEIGLQCGFYYKDGEDIDVFYDGYDNADVAADEYLRPIISQVLKWLREEKKILITIIPQEKNLGHDTLCFGVYRITEDLYQPIYNGTINTLVDSYEETALAGIEYVLDNLI